MKLKDFPGFLGFTGTEIRILFFLLAVFLVGLAVKFFNADGLHYKPCEYVTSDSVFLSGSGSRLPGSSMGKASFFPQKPKNKVPAEKSVDINSATMEQLMSLPGIGEKTAEKIIILRTQKGGFNSIEEIKEVKGIQFKKFERIKNFIFIGE